jgi:hypothetical protein
MPGYKFKKIMQDQGNQLMKNTHLHCRYHLIAKMNNGIESLIMLIERSLKPKTIRYNDSGRRYFTQNSYIKI